MEFTHLPFYDCLETEKITGRRPFPLISEEIFTERLEGYHCIDLT